MNNETLEKANRLRETIDSYEYLIKSHGEKPHMFIKLRGGGHETPLVGVCGELSGQIIDLIRQRKEQLENVFSDL